MKLKIQELQEESTKGRDELKLGSELGMHSLEAWKLEDGHVFEF